jgi:hypothetical protein
MDRALVKGFTRTVPPGLETLFNDPPLVGDEKREDYENLFWAVVAAIKPSDAVVWLLARDFADLQWEIQRERKLKLNILKLAQLEWISKFLSPARPALLELPHMPPTTEKLAELWSADAETRQSIDNKLAKKGFDASFVMTQALKRAAPQIEAIDRRIGTYEMRRMAAMKAIEQYSEASARRLAASTDVIDGEFTEAEE